MEDWIIGSMLGKTIKGIGSYLSGKSGKHRSVSLTLDNGMQVQFFGEFEIIVEQNKPGILSVSVKG